MYVLVENTIKLHVSRVVLFPAEDPAERFLRIWRENQSYP